MEITKDALAYLEYLAGGNETMAAALFLCTSTLLSILVGGLPSKIWKFMRRQIFVELTIDNSGWDKKDMFIRINKYISSVTHADNINRFNLDALWDKKDTAVLTHGSGVHFIRLEGRLVLFDKQIEVKENGTVAESITLTAFKRNAGILKALITHGFPDPDAGGLSVFMNRDSSWIRLNREPKKDFSALALDPEIRSKILSEVVHFLDGRKQFIELNLTYKLSFLLHGLPGTGKTSIVKAIASTYDLPIYVLNISKVKEVDLHTLINGIPERSILLLEDFDSCHCLHKVSKNEKVNEYLNRSTILNLLDGVISLNGLIVFMTTNHIELIEPSVYRPGRVDVNMELPMLTDVTVREYLNMMGLNLADNDERVKSMLACELTILVRALSIRNLK